MHVSSLAFIIFRIWLKETSFKKAITIDEKISSPKEVSRNDDGLKCL